jgi:dTDP-4-dehydrorhamnose 3,5-epimerase
VDRLRTRLSGPVLLQPAVHGDARGFFLETYRRSVLADFGIKDEFVQDNHSRSVKGVLRGLHFTVNRPQAQIVTVIRGKIFDVAVDLRKSSPTVSARDASYPPLRELDASRLPRVDD